MEGPTTRPRPSSADELRPCAQARNLAGRRQLSAAPSTSPSCAHACVRSWPEPAPPRTAPRERASLPPDEAAELRVVALRQTYVAIGPGDHRAQEQGGACSLSAFATRPSTACASSRATSLVASEISTSAGPSMRARAMSSGASSRERSIVARAAVHRDRAQAGAAQGPARAGGPKLAGPRGRPPQPRRIGRVTGVTLPARSTPPPTAGSGGGRMSHSWARRASSNAAVHSPWKRRSSLRYTEHCPRNGTRLACLGLAPLREGLLSSPGHVGYRRSPRDASIPHRNRRSPMTMGDNSSRSGQPSRRRGAPHRALVSAEPDQRLAPDRAR